MSKYCAENERVKRDYSFFLEAANGKQDATIDAALRAIERFEITTNRKPFRKFNVEQARSFRARLGEETGGSGKLGDPFRRVGAVRNGGVGVEVDHTPDATGKPE